MAYRLLATAPVYVPARDVAVHLMGCNHCTTPILMLIHAQPVHNLEDYARDMRPLYQEQNLPTLTLIAGPPIGARGGLCADCDGAFEALLRQPHA